VNANPQRADGDALSRRRKTTIRLALVLKTDVKPGNVITEAGQRLERYEKQIESVVEGWRWAPVVKALMSLRGAGGAGRDRVVKLSAAWGGLRKHKPLVAAPLDWLKGASPKLLPPADRLAIGGGMI
jgi:hypothetical protein